MKGGVFGIWMGYGGWIWGPWMCQANLYFHGCYFPFSYFLLLSRPPWQPIFWAVEKIAIEGTLEDTFCLLATPTNFVCAFPAKRNKSLRFDCPLIYKFRKIRIKANNFELAEWNSAAVWPSSMVKMCGKRGSWEIGSGGTGKPHKLPALPVQHKEKLKIKTKAALLAPWKHGQQSQ